MAQVIPVTVVLVNWNGGALVLQTLQALSAQTVQPAQVVVIDNASSDGSAENIARRFKVRLRCLERNLGFAAANNLALREEVQTPWVATLNPDAVPQPDWLERLWQGVQAYPGYAAYGCRMRRLDDPTRLDGTGDCYHPSGIAWRRDFGVPERQGQRMPGEIFAPCAAAALYRLEDVLAVGGFDEDFFCYFEDVDLGFRLRLSGGRCFYLPEAIVHHKGAYSTDFRSDFAVYHGLRNLIWCWWKNMPKDLRWRYLPWHLAGVLGLVLRAVWRRQGQVAVRAVRDAVRGLPKMAAKRMPGRGKTATSAMTRSVKELYAAFRQRQASF